MRKKDPKEVQTHIQIHELIETALAANDPPGVRLQLARMVGSGMSRHEALHNLGIELYRGLQKMTQQQENSTARQ